MILSRVKNCIIDRLSLLETPYLRRYVYANVKLCTTATKVSGARNICSTEKDMVTGPTGETRLILPSRELQTVGRLAFNE